MATGLVACSALVWQSSHASFSSTTSNDANELAAGTVVIGDNDGGSQAMFAASSMTPGAAGTPGCIGVTYTGSLTPTAIKMYFPTTGLAPHAMESAAGAPYVDWVDSDASEMDKYTTMHIEYSNELILPPAFNDCAPAGFTTWTEMAPATSTIQSLIKNNNTYAGALLTMPAMTKDKWRVFRFSYDLPLSAPNSVQGDGVQFAVTWEARQ
ncbi:hypothetical protein [Paractinoplanes maris]|uniref:hypothetical protein n=1 Tax=Paractinoplanes maris TaxID=1734446 RepID=UPI0020218B93|nr:hypothetical protein [Actinoplanes maris]